MNQEIEECMNTITGALTKLRAHIRKLGVAGTEPERCKKCGRYLIAAYTSGRIHCPYCLQKELTAIPDFLRGESESPNPHVGTGIPNGIISKYIVPLNARVAKALGWVVTIDKLDGKWIGHHKSITSGVWWYSIPDYDEHVDLAMGAIREYCKKDEYDRFAHIIYRADADDYYVEMNDWDEKAGKTIMFAGIHEFLPQAICEAIAQHAEGMVK